MIKAFVFALILLALEYIFYSIMNAVYTIPASSQYLVGLYLVVPAIVSSFILVYRNKSVLTKKFKLFVVVSYVVLFALKFIWNTSQLFEMRSGGYDPVPFLGGFIFSTATVFLVVAVVLYLSLTIGSALAVKIRNPR